jgi:hypothetical protein
MQPLKAEPHNKLVEEEVKIAYSKVSIEPMVVVYKLKLQKL